MKTGRTRLKTARRLGLTMPSKNGYRSLRQRMRDFPLDTPAHRTTSHSSARSTGG